MNEESLQNPLNERCYFFSADFLRIVLIFCLILARYGVPFLSGLVTPFLGFAPGTLFLFYGYFVLRDGADLKKNIKHAAKVFGIMFVVCFVLATVYMWLVYGKPFAYFTKRGIFNFVVLNYWGPSMGDYIWMVQSTLYALVICYLFRKLKKYDVAICITLFVISFLIGEGAGFLNFNVLGYSYIPGNFLTRTLPYMLLGRIIFRKQNLLENWKTWVYFVFILAGLGLCVLEVIGFSKLGKLVYYGHLTGFILIAFGLAGLMITTRYYWTIFSLKKVALYKKMYFLYNPVGEILQVLFAVFVSTEDEYIFANMYGGVLACLLTLLIAVGLEKGLKLVDNLRRRRLMY